MRLTAACAQTLENVRDRTIATMPARFAALGGLGDAPYPPNYPKQEGEPPRVQPSKEVAAHRDEQGNRVDR